MVTVDSLKVNIRIPYITFWLGILITIGLVLLDYYVGGKQINTERITLIVGVGMGLTSLLYSSYNFAKTNEIHQKALGLEKLKATMSIIDRWSEPGRVPLIQPVNVFIRENSKLDTSAIVERIDEDLELSHSAIHVLNFLESLAIGIEYGVIDENMAKDYFRGIVLTYTTSLKKLIDLGRVRTGNRMMFIKLEALATRWTSS